MRRLKWATTWENLFMPYANNKGADQPNAQLPHVSYDVWANSKGSRKTAQAAPMAEWLRPLIFSALNPSSSYHCGFEPNMGHVIQAKFCLSMGRWFFSGISRFHPTYRMTRLKVSEIILTGCKTQIHKKKKKKKKKKDCTDVQTGQSLCCSLFAYVISFTHGDLLIFCMVYSNLLMQTDIQSHKAS